MAKTEKVGIWMPLFIGDFRSDTNGRSLEFKAMYLNLLMECWQNDGQIDSDESHLCGVSGGTERQWIKHRQALFNLFYPGDGFWMHNGIREQLAIAKRTSKSRSEAGTKANEVRWAKDRAAREQALSQAALLAQIERDGSAH